MADDKLELLKKLTRLANNNPNENEANLAARKVCKMLEELKWALPAATTAKPIDKVKQAYDDIFGRGNAGSWTGFGGNYGSDTQRKYQEARSNEYTRYYEQQARAQAEEYIRQEEARRKAKADEAKEKAEKAKGDDERRKRDAKFSQFIKDQQRDSSRPAPYGDMRSNRKFWATEKEYITYMREKFVHWERNPPKYEEVHYAEPDYDLNWKPMAENKPPRHKWDTGRRTLICKTCGKEVETGYVGPKLQFECFRCQFKEPFK